MTQRYKLVFDDPDAFAAMQAIEAGPGHIVAQNEVRRALSLEMNADPEDVRKRLAWLPEGVHIAPEIQYDLENGVDFDPFVDIGIEAVKEADMDTVLGIINARDAWTRTQGAGVTLAIVDTGIAGRRPEFGSERRVGGWSALGQDPWADYLGHGSMCAAIAAASREDGGSIDGVAPRASLMSCRTRFGEVELSAIYDALRMRRLAGETIVASNSFGRRVSIPPTPEPGNLFVEAMNDAIGAGVHVFFSAGNYHEDVGGAPEACDPTSIWLHKSRSDVLSVGACDQDLKMWGYSSRGPGQNFGRPNTNQKPDVIAPTPRNGEILYGDQLRVLPIGWGTSGACPQVAGRACLMLSLDPTLTSHDLFTYIRDTARNLGFGPNCQGAGMIDCAAALEKIREDHGDR